MSGLQVNQAEIARILGVSTRTVQRWHAEGFPRQGEGSRTEYDVAEAVAWVRRRDREQWERELATGPVPDLDEARARKEMALARLREYDLAERERSMITIEDVEDIVSTLLFRLRAKLLNLPSKWAPSLVGCRTIPEAQSRLDDAIFEAMTALSQDDDLEDPDADPEFEAEASEPAA